jgi:hypothetical protein
MPHSTPLFNRSNATRVRVRPRTGGPAVLWLTWAETRAEGRGFVLREGWEQRDGGKIPLDTFQLGGWQALVEFAYARAAALGYVVIFL